MDIAVTGGSGRLGRLLIPRLLDQGHRVCSLDLASAPAGIPSDKPVQYIQVDLQDLQAVTDAMRGCEAVIHLAAHTGPFGHPPGEVYRNNTLLSYNILQAASSLEMHHVCLASSINALGGIGSRKGHFDYFPVDELHPTYSEDDYSLSKWVMEQQADSFARRFPQMSISSLRFHALPEKPPELIHALVPAEDPAARGLWGWTLISDAARACDLAIQARFTGHEVFFIVAPRTMSAVHSLKLAQFAYPDVLVRGDLSGYAGFYDCRKAERLLGWVHSRVETGS